jgi:hypothetical protein
MACTAAAVVKPSPERVVLHRLFALAAGIQPPRISRRTPAVTAATVAVCKRHVQRPHCCAGLAIRTHLCLPYPTTH